MLSSQQVVALARPEDAAAMWEALEIYPGEGIFLLNQHDHTKMSIVTQSKSSNVFVVESGLYSIHLSKVNDESYIVRQFSQCVHNARLKWMFWPCGQFRRAEIVFGSRCKLTMVKCLDLLKFVARWRQRRKIKHCIFDTLLPARHLGFIVQSYLMCDGPCLKKNKLV